jgi:hypothetical protein
MSDQSDEQHDAPRPKPGRWYLFLHQVPPRPAYFRARVLRQLLQLGALAVKNSAYLLPANEETLEDLEWLRNSIISEQGEAWIFQCDTVSGHTDESLREDFRELRAGDYRQLEEELLVLRKGLREGAAAGERETSLEPDREKLRALAKIRKRYEEIRKIDFFEAPQGREVVTLMEELDRSLTPGAEQTAAPSETLDAYQGRRWVTRQGVKIDRMASAWLITRFIDRKPEFGFVKARGYRPRPSELRFDMFEGEFTHADGKCTFEVLLDRMKLEDPVLHLLGKLVHDIDLKDNLYDLPETAGIAAVIDGIVARCPDDPERLDEGRRLFDSLYEQFARSQAG